MPEETNKKICRIIVISTCFHHKDIRAMTENEQAEYYYKIFKTIREVFSPKEAEIVFKLHPSEPDIYRHSREDFDVVVVAENAKAEEVVALSDLYIAHPMTTVNNMPRALGMSAIFINFSGLDFITESAAFYNIKHVALNHSDFKWVLEEYKRDTLPLQYNNSGIEREGIERTVEFVG